MKKEEYKREMFGFARGVVTFGAMAVASTYLHFKGLPMVGLVSTRGNISDVELIRDANTGLAFVSSAITFVQLIGAGATAAYYRRHRDETENDSEEPEIGTQVVKPEKRIVDVDGCAVVVNVEDAVNNEARRLRDEGEQSAGLKWD